MPTIFIKTDHDLFSYDLAPGADLQVLLPLLAEDLGEPEDNIQLFLHGNRLYPGTALIRDQTYEVSIVPVEHLLLRASYRFGEWQVEQIHMDTEERIPLSRTASGRYQIRHSEQLRYHCDLASFSLIEFLPGDHVLKFD